MDLKRLSSKVMAAKKRQELPKKPKAPVKAPAKDSRGDSAGTLYVVATPIGNLEDLTPRARRVFGEVDGVLCEDTRMTAKLLNAATVERADGGSFEGRLARLDHHASDGRLDSVVERLLAGENLALVSDAGTPAISDPGAELVSLAVLAGITVVTIPGPSALTAFLAGAGFTAGSPVFRGFFPRKDSDRETELAYAKASPFAAIYVWFESPERIEESLGFLAERVPEARGVAAKEMTKLHERFYSGCLKDLTSHIQSASDAGEVRGEWVIGVSFDAVAPVADGNPSEWPKALRCLLNSGISASSAAREVSQVFGISRNLVYTRAVEMAKSRE
jgi:16S rRNA (cytidine1402-2'-O)-methyltransferase